MGLAEEGKDATASLPSSLSEEMHIWCVIAVPTLWKLPQRQVSNILPWEMTGEVPMLFSAADYQISTRTRAA